jgi:hypothetical protein
MKKKLFFVLLMFSSLTSKGQGIHAGLGGGSEFIRLELGYSILENLHIGAQASPMSRAFDIPAYYAGYLRFNFEGLEINDNLGRNMIGFSMIRPYVGASFGTVRYKYNEFFSSDKQIINISQIGFSGNIGIESSNGFDGVFASFVEISFGQIPNAFDDFFNKKELADNSSSISLTSFWGLNGGIRFYFGNL